MAANRLKAPVADFHLLPLSIVTLAPGRLYRVSRHDTGEPYFGQSAAKRVDDPARVYGTCYLGLSLTVAFAESVLHDADPSGGHFHVPPNDISRRYAVSFDGADLRLANLTGSQLSLLGGNGELSGTADYTLPQQWSSALHAHPQDVDGFLYRSRLINDSLAVVLFKRVQRGARKMRVADSVALCAHINFLATMAQLRVK